MGVGSLLLLAAASETQLLPCLETALIPNLSAAASSLRVARSRSATLRCQVLTLLFLQTVGLQRTWDLRGYTGQTLALLTGRDRAYGYRHTERFLAELASTGGDALLTEALARWIASLWEVGPQGKENPVPVFYVDGHRKPVYADALIPRGLIGRTGKVLGCRALVVLHDQEGHPLLVTTHRGDQHLTIGLPPREQGSPKPQKEQASHILFHRASCPLSRVAWPGTHLTRPWVCLTTIERVPVWLEAVLLPLSGSQNRAQPTQSNNLEAQATQFCRERKHRATHRTGRSANARAPLRPMARSSSNG